MKKIVPAFLACAVLAVGGFFLLNAYIYEEKQASPSYGTDPKNTAYIIEGETVVLVGGIAKSEEKTTRYFGNELVFDLNGDGREDRVFLITQDGGGPEVFYYVVAALNTPEGWLGSDGYFLGDRIAPQTTEASRNPRHKFVVVVNYAERPPAQADAPGEPMTARPSIGRSAYLKLDVERMQWGIVEPDFEGESR